ncbi:MAG TPA: tRNA pseudouridine(55) synthase TruB, partial [Puia sp.]|nr:tRNA pseudouridine(55) synthase TruB [Puia sp.]
MTNVIPIPPITFAQHIMEQEEKNIYKAGQVLLIDKPKHWTSFAVVKKVNYLLKGIKVGHAGTLDPLATGLLILCTGKFTKRINEFMAQEKEYTGTFTLGATTITYDLEAEPQDFRDITGLTDEAILAAAKQFTGEIAQVPPAHSAIKKNGQRAYQMARRGEAVKLSPRKIFIREFEIVKVELPVVHFRVVCS